MNLKNISRLLLGPVFLFAGQTAFSNAGKQQMYKREIVSCNLIYSSKKADPVLQIGNLVYNVYYFKGTETESINNLDKITVYGDVATTLPFAVHSEDGELQGSEAQFRAGRMNAVQWYDNENSALKSALEKVIKYPSRVGDKLVNADQSAILSTAQFQSMYLDELVYFKINSLTKENVSGELRLQMGQVGLVYAVDGACTVKTIN